MYIQKEDSVIKKITPKYIQKDKSVIKRITQNLIQTTTITLTSILIKLKKRNNIKSFNFTILD